MATRNKLSANSARFSLNRLVYPAIGRTAEWHRDQGSLTPLGIHDLHTIFSGFSPPRHLLKHKYSWEDPIPAPHLYLPGQMAGICLGGRG